MNEAEIRKYAMLMQELGLTGLEVKENVGVVRLERAGAAAPAASAAAAEPVAAQSPAPSAGLLIRSPMVGVFYAAPTEDSEPFIKEGDHVKKGDTLCVIEAMKLMNEITAEEMGTVREVCVKDADPVEFGTVLFYIEPHSVQPVSEQ